MNKAPDKIYIQELSDGTWDDCFVYESSETDTNGKKRVPYLRKDALLEWAKEHQEGERQGSYTWSCYQIFIDKLNEM